MTFWFTSPIVKNEKPRYSRKSSCETLKADEKRKTKRGKEVLKGQKKDRRRDWQRERELIVKEELSTEENEEILGSKVN